MRQLSILMTLAAAIVIAGGCASGVDAGGPGDGADETGENGQPLLDGTPGVDDADVLNAVSSTTTTVDRGESDGPDLASTTVVADSATAAAAGPADRSAADGSEDDEQAMALLADALSTSDLCEVYAALDSLTVRGSDLHELSHTLDVVAATLHASDPFVPESLADSWAEMEHELDRARSELAKPDAERQTVVDIFDAPDFAEAHTEIEVWREANCA